MCLPRQRRDAVEPSLAQAVGSTLRGSLRECERYGSKATGRSRSVHRRVVSARGADSCLERFLCHWF